MGVLIYFRTNLKFIQWEQCFAVKQEKLKKLRRRNRRPTTSKRPKSQSANTERETSQMMMKKILSWIHRLVFQLSGTGNP